MTSWTAPAAVIDYYRGQNGEVLAPLRNDMLGRIDRWVKSPRCPKGQSAFGNWAGEMTAHRKRRLIKELLKLDRKQERVLTDARFWGETPWPEY